MEKLLECITHQCDRVEREPSGVMRKGWYEQLTADEVEIQAVVRVEVVGEHLFVVVGRESSEWWSGGKSGTLCPGLNGELGNVATALHSGREIR